MKNIFSKGSTTLFILVAIVFLGTSCGGPSRFDLKDTNGMKQVGEIIGKHITEDMIVHTIDLKNSDSKSFTPYIDKALLVYVDAEKPQKLHGLDIDLKTGEATVNNFYESKSTSKNIKYKGLNMPADFDFSTVATAVNKAYEAAKEEDYKIDGVGTVTISFSDGKLNKANMYFKLQHITGTTYQGSVKRISYEEARFKADLEGEFID